MRKIGFSAFCVAIVVGLCLAPGQVLADKKTKVYKAQTTRNFVNGETVSAFGLTIALSTEGEVKTDNVTGQAGPFRDVIGNGSNKITLTNAEAPIEPGSDGIELVLGTYSKKISIKNWWWVDAEGKRIGEKKKG
jgi:hypothetical protein